MLKELVRERLMAAADEIFELFERTIASYEEELSRTREENERQRRQLEAFYKNPIVLPTEHVQKLIGRQEERPTQQHSLMRGGWGSKVEPPQVKDKEEPQPPCVKDEDEELWITQEGECLLGPDDADLSKLPLTVVSVKTEDDGDEPQDVFFAPLSDSDDAASHFPEAEGRDDGQEPLSSDSDCEGETRTHTRLKHSEGPEKKTGKKCLTCPVCAKSFSDKRYFPLHMRTHTGEKPFSCSICDKRFSQNSHMLSHMRTHTGEKPFSCSVCSERFSKKSNIVKHMRTHTGEKPFSCSVCGASFAQRFTLKRHMTTHTREKPFSCSVCGEGFAVQMSLIRHQRTHTGEKPFSCPVCDKRFSHKSNMTAHMRTHTGEKAFVCSVCGKSYSYKTSLTIHMRTHNGE
uniref:zinc finger protein 771-like isoform X2 n=1 Tax=Doryrhamphus excisus TaxID=161450 RepID=UPI0025ADCF06|nr:zinc finger protein 771-like isoform X2 [Doryrhamphus excisus]